MNSYTDTAVLVTALTDETHRPKVQQWLAAQLPGTLYLSWWTLAEFASATARKVREGKVSTEEMLAVRLVFDTGLKPVFKLLSVTRDDFDRAASFAGRPEVNLRASDALHLAVANAHGLQLVTLDKRMASGGAALGVATLLL